MNKKISNKDLANVFKRRAEERLHRGHVASSPTLDNGLSRQKEQREKQKFYQSILNDLTGMQCEPPILHENHREASISAPRRQQKPTGRRTVITDMRVRIDDHLRNAGREFDKILGEAQRLPAEKVTPTEPEKKVALVEALKKIRTVEKSLSAQPPGKISGREVHQIDVMKTCLIDGKPLTALAGSRSGAARSAAHKMLIETLKTILASLAVDSPQDKRLEAAPS